MIPFPGGFSDRPKRKIRWANILKLRKFLDNTPRKSNVISADEYLRHGDKIHLYMHGSKGPNTTLFNECKNDGNHLDYQLGQEFGCFFHFFKNKFFSWNGWIYRARYHHGAEQQYSCDAELIKESSLGWRKTFQAWLEFIGLPPRPLVSLELRFMSPFRMILATSVVTSILTVLLMKVFA